MSEEKTQSYKILTGARLPIKIFIKDIDSIEEEAKKQLIQVANLPWVDGLSVMPDVHFGKGATVGSVIAQNGALSPSVIGVDIGCGMAAFKTNVKVDQLGGDKGLKELRHSIERSVPVGFNWNKSLTKSAEKLLKELGPISQRGEQFFERASVQLGSLGGGNHFIEICSDLEGLVWIMLHSGSRNVGKQLADHHISTAKGLMGGLVKKYPTIQNNPIPKDLAALLVGSDEYNAYLEDLMWCQRYAAANRTEMMSRILKDFSHHVFKEHKLESHFVTQKVMCHHNYLSEEQTPLGVKLVTRKGAVSAKEGEFGIIPGSMGAKSFIVKGKGNPDSFCSCSHGAGRKMSRTKARKSFTLDDLQKQTDGVECRKDGGVLDEIPSAYKDIEEVMESQSDLVEIVAELKQLICIKG